MAATEGSPTQQQEFLQFANRLLHIPPEDRQLDEITVFLEKFSLDSLNFETLQLVVKNKHYSQDIKELHRLVAHSMQFVQYISPHRELKHKDSCKFQCSIILEGSVKVFDWRDREETKELLRFKSGDVILDKHLLKTLQRPILFVFAENTSLGVAKYEDFQETLCSSAEEKEDQKIISSFPLFQSLPLYSFNILCSLFTLKTCIKGESIFENSSPVDAIYIIKKGEFIMEEEVAFIQDSSSSNESNSSDDENTHKSHSIIDDLTELSMQFNARKKKSSRKNMGTRVLVAGELFGEDDIIREFCSRHDNTASLEIANNKAKQPLQQLSVKTRTCSAKCLSIKAELLVLKSTDLIHRVLEKVRPKVLKQFLARSELKRDNYAQSVNKIRKSVMPYSNFLIPQSSSILTASNSPRDPLKGQMRKTSVVIFNQRRSSQKSNQSNSKSNENILTNIIKNDVSNYSNQLKPEQQQYPQQQQQQHCILKTRKTNRSQSIAASVHFRDTEETVRFQSLNRNPSKVNSLILHNISPRSKNHFLKNDLFADDQNTSSLACLQTYDEVQPLPQTDSNFNRNRQLELVQEKNSSIQNNNDSPNIENNNSNTNNNSFESSHDHSLMRIKSFSQFDLSSSMQQSQHLKDSLQFRQQLIKTRTQFQTKFSVKEIPIETTSSPDGTSNNSTKTILQFHRASLQSTSFKSQTPIQSTYTRTHSKSISNLCNSFGYDSILGNCTAVGIIGSSPLAQKDISKVTDQNTIKSARKMIQKNEPCQFIKYVPLADHIKQKIELNLNDKKQQKQQLQSPPNQQTKQMNKSLDSSKQNQQKQTHQIHNNESSGTVTYAGLGSKLEKQVGDRSMKIKLLTPIFSRGYKDNFIKEMDNLNRRNRKHNYLVEFKNDSTKRQEQSNKIINDILRNNVKSAHFNNKNNSNIIFSSQSHFNLKGFNSNNNCNLYQNSKNNHQQLNENYSNNSNINTPSAFIPVPVPLSFEGDNSQIQTVSKIQMLSHSPKNNSFQTRPSSSVPSSPLRLSSPQSPIIPFPQSPINPSFYSTSQPSSPFQNKYPSYYLFNVANPSKLQQQYSYQKQQHCQFPSPSETILSVFPSSFTTSTKDCTPLNKNHNHNTPSTYTYQHSKGFQGKKKKIFSSFEASNTNSSQQLKRHSCEPIERQPQKLQQA